MKQTNRIFVTGDTHGYDTDRLFRLNELDLTKDDVLIIAGDCGLIFSVDENDQREKENKTILNNLKYSILCVLGNHENYDRIESLPTLYKYKALVGYESEFPNIYYAKHGFVYTINNRSIWVMNGGYSIDKHHRIPGVSWWEQEIPTKSQLDFGLETFETYKDEIDVIVTHTCPKCVEPIDMSPFKDQVFNVDKTLEDYFDIIYNKGGFNKEWYCGHWHFDGKRRNIRFVYHDMVEITKR